MPNGMRVLISSIVVPEEAGVDFSVNDFRQCYFLKQNAEDEGRYSFIVRGRRSIVHDLPNADRNWQKKYFFLKISDLSIEMSDRYHFCSFWGIVSECSSYFNLFICFC